MPRPNSGSGGPLDTATAVSAPAPAFEIDATALAAYCQSHVASFPNSSSNSAPQLRVLKFTHGQCNPTYLLQVRAWLNVLDSRRRERKKAKKERGIG